MEHSKEKLQQKAKSDDEYTAVAAILPFGDATHQRQL